MIKLTDIIDTIKDKQGIKADAQLERNMGIPEKTLSKWRKRDTLKRSLLEYCVKIGLSLDEMFLIQEEKNKISCPPAEIKTGVGDDPGTSLKSQQLIELLYKNALIVGSRNDHVLREILDFVNLSEKHRDSVLHFVHNTKNLLAQTDSAVEKRILPHQQNLPADAHPENLFEGFSFTDKEVSKIVNLLSNKALECSDNEGYEAAVENYEAALKFKPDDLEIRQRIKDLKKKIPWKLYIDKKECLIGLKETYKYAVHKSCTVILKKGGKELCNKDISFEDEDEFMIMPRQGKEVIFVGHQKKEVILVDIEELIFKVKIDHGKATLIIRKP